MGTTQVDNTGLSIVIAGATGEVGQRVAERLNRYSQVESITALVRPSPRANLLAQHNDKVTLAPLTDTLEAPTRADVFICTLGTTIKIAGSQQAFHEIDHDLVVKCAKQALAAGATRCVVMSSVGASTQSGSFYLKTKGQMEANVGNLGFASCLFIRPSLLLGPRKAFRLGERLAALPSQLINPLLLGPLSRYRSINMDTVASAIAQVVLAPDQSSAQAIWEFDQLQQHARQFEQAHAKI